MPGTRVLVVDDDPDIIDYFCSFLRDNGYDACSALSSETALEVIDDFHPDIVLIDILMPGKSGLDLLVRIRRHPRWSDLPLVVITGNDRILRDECQSYLASYSDVRGPDAVLAKPVDRDALTSLLEHLNGDNGDHPA